MNVQSQLHSQIESMSASFKNDIHEFWREFIELYKSFPALWKAKSAEYKNRQLKNDCYQILAKKLHQIEPGADRYVVRRKVNILRSNYRREQKKVLASKTYKPTLWYFNYMQFLSNQVDDSEAEHGETDTECSENIDNTELELNEQQACLTNYTNIQGVFGQCENKLNDDSVGTSFDTFDDIESTIKSENLSDNADLPMVSMPRRHEKIADKFDDDIDIQSKVWMSEFRKLNAEQRMFAKKAIDDILFEGRLAGLNRFSVQINGRCNNN